MAPFFGGTSQSPGDRLFSMDFFSVVEEADICPDWNKHIFWKSFAFRVHASISTTIHGLTICLIYHLGTLDSIVFDQGTHFTAA